MAGFDLVIKNGTVIDPSQGLHAKKDIAVSGGVVHSIEDHIPDGDARDVIEADGLIVTPGLVDLHVHIWWGVAHLAIEADPSSLARGASPSGMWSSISFTVSPSTIPYTAPPPASNRKYFIVALPRLSSESGATTRAGSRKYLVSDARRKCKVPAVPPPSRLDWAAERVGCCGAGTRELLSQSLHISLPRYSLLGSGLALIALAGAGMSVGFSLIPTLSHEERGV